MYLRTTKRKNKDGSVVTYYHLAYNVRHPETNQPTPRIIHNFGRADQLDRQQLVRLCSSIARVCELKVTDPLRDVSPPPAARAEDWPETLEKGKVKIVQNFRLGVTGLCNLRLQHFYNQDFALI